MLFLHLFYIGVHWDVRSPKVNETHSWEHDIYINGHKILCAKKLICK